MAEDHLFSPLTQDLVRRANRAKEEARLLVEDYAFLCWRRRFLERQFHEEFGPCAAQETDANTVPPSR
jgi:hypothetical protein